MLLLIKYYGATNTEIVKSLRKVLSIALSFAIYPKPMNGKYVAGMAATAASLVISYRLQRRKARLHARAACSALVLRLMLWLVPAAWPGECACASAGGCGRAGVRRAPCAACQ